MVLNMLCIDYFSNPVTQRGKQRQAWFMPSGLKKKVNCKEKANCSVKINTNSGFLDLGKIHVH